MVRKLRKRGRNCLEVKAAEREGRVGMYTGNRERCCTLVC